MSLSRFHSTRDYAMLLFLLLFFFFYFDPHLMLELSRSSLDFGNLSWAVVVVKDASRLPPALLPGESGSQHQAFN